MADKEIIILDEPTTGLDPLMRKVFLDIIKKEQAKGKTILMSSQSFAELEEICDRVALIFNGKIVDIADIKGLKNQDSSILKIEFEQEAEYLKFKTLGYEIVRDQEEFWQATIKIKNEKLNELFGVLQNFKLRFIVCEEFNLEKHFKSILLKGGTNV